MKAKELRERTDADLVELGRQIIRDLFGQRMKNLTGQLDDTSQLRKGRRDLARIASIQSERALVKSASTASGSQT
jgi:large subunit ribosomal protein L29